MLFVLFLVRYAAGLQSYSASNRRYNNEKNNVQQTNVGERGCGRILFQGKQRRPGGGNSTPPPTCYEWEGGAMARIATRSVRNTTLKMRVKYKWLDVLHEAQLTLLLYAEIRVLTHSASHKKHGFSRLVTRLTGRENTFCKI